MTTQKIDVGQQANDNQGDPLRTAFQKCNSNFDEIDINTTNIANHNTQISSNTANISLCNDSIALKANDSDVLKKDGSVSLNSGYTPNTELDLTTKEYVDSSTSQIEVNTNNIAINTSTISLKANETDVLKKDGSVSLNSGYTPSSSLSVATKAYVDSETAAIATNTANIASNATAISLKANEDIILKRDGTIPLNSGYTPNLDLDISTKKYVDDSIASIETSSGASETDLLTISNESEKFSDGVSDNNQSSWNIRAKNKIESNTTAMASKATQADMTSITNRVTTAEGNISTNTSSINALATVANSGSYTDLSDKPFIPANNSELSNDSGFITNISSFDTDNLTEGNTNLYDKIISITGGTDIAVTGTYPNFTINSTTTGGGSDPTLISGGVPTYSGNQDLFPIIMTDYTAPITEECWTTSNIDTTTVAWKCFDKSNSSEVDCWITAENLDMFNNPEMALRKMTASTPISAIKLTSRNFNLGSLYPVNFKFIYTTEDMSSYSNIDINIRNITFTEVKTVSGESFNQAESKIYILDTDIPTNATAWGIAITEGNDPYPNHSAIGKMEGISNPYLIDISKIKCRSDDDTQDIEIMDVSLDITSSTSWASEELPSLENTTIHIWADYNYGSPRFILDDATGSNISGKKRYRWSFLTDSNLEIIPWNIVGEGKRLKAYYKSSIQDFSSLTTSYVDYSLTVPEGILLEPITKIQSDGNIVYSSTDGIDDIYQGNYNVYLETLTSNASIKLKKSSGTVSIGHTIGYIIES